MARPAHRRRIHPAQRLWDQAADVWDDFEEAGKDVSRDRVHGPALLRAIGPLRGRRVLDLGCGQGRFTRRLARRGGIVAGIDWAPAMIERAQARERTEHLGIDFRLGDARFAARDWPARSFDLVVSCMALMDMPELPLVLNQARKLLRPEGGLVFSIAHPMNTSAAGWTARPGRKGRGMLIDRYFEVRSESLDWTMPRLRRPFRSVFWHRPLQEWFRLLEHAGFQITGLREPRASAAQVRTEPLLAGTREFPFFLVIRCGLLGRRRTLRPRRAAGG